MPALTGMKPDGFYDRHSSFQQQTMQSVIGWVESAVAEMPLPHEMAPFTIADYGCSEGANSILAIGRIANALRARRPHQPLVAVHADLPSNNFNQLIANLNDAGRPNYYQAGGTPRSDTYAIVCGGSFYGALLPLESVHVGTSFLAVEWMDRVPEVSLPQSISYSAGSPAVQAAFARQADDDLTRFLACRARELVAGGKLLIVIPGADGGQRCGDGLITVLDDALCDLVEAGHIAGDRFERFLLPVYYRNLEEMTAPVTRSDSPVHGAFTVERAETLTLPVSFVEEFKRTGDVETYSATYTSFLRAFSEPVIVAALRASPADDALGDLVYDRVRQRLTAEPERYPLRNIEVAILYSRR